MTRWSAAWAASLLLLLLVAACGSSGADESVERAATPSSRSPSSTSTSPSTSTTDATSTTTGAPAQTTPRPDWLGTRVLPEGPGGFGEVQPTPPELVDRRFATIDVLPPPTDERFAPTVQAVPDDVVSRSTWGDGCPVALEDLRYVMLPFWGFDGALHTGELLVHADAVDAVVSGFGTLFERRFPIEEMRITTAQELDAPPTGDGSNTGAFVCRPSRGATTWSDHAHGRAVDINPFHNPYVKGDLVLPELASAYVDRSEIRAGMLTAEDVAGFTDAGWGWGGTWTSLRDHMHLSASGR